jgi:hypothetical protein
MMEASQRNESLIKKDGFPFKGMKAESKNGS